MTELSTIIIAIRQEIPNLLSNNKYTCAAIRSTNIRSPFPLPLSIHESCGRTKYKKPSTIGEVSPNRQNGANHTAAKFWAGDRAVVLDCNNLVDIRGGRRPSRRRRGARKRAFLDQEEQAGKASESRSEGLDDAHVLRTHRYLFNFWYGTLI